MLASPQKETLYPKAPTPHSLLFQPPPPHTHTHNDQSASVSACVCSGHSYKWDGTVSGLWCQASFPMYHLFTVHPCSSVWQAIIFHSCIVFCCVEGPPSACPSSVSAHTGCLPLLAVVTDTIHRSVQVFPRDPAFCPLGSLPKSRIAGSHGESARCHIT